MSADKPKRPSMNRPRIDIHSIQFIPEGVAVQYNTLPDDVRVDGRVMLTHEIRLHSSHPDYREDVESLERKAQRMVENALDDFANSLPFEPPADDDEDDDGPGMGE